MKVNTSTGYFGSCCEITLCSCKILGRLCHIILTETESHTVRINDAVEIVSLALFQNF